MQFGRKSEKLDPGQFALALEDVEQAVAASEAADDKQNKAAAAARAEKRRANRGALPAHLPRVHVTIEPEDRTCPCCRSPMHAIGADVSERLDVIPAQFRVLVTRRPKYACRACEESVVQASAPERLIKGWRYIQTHPDLDHMRGLKNLHEHVGFHNFWDTEHTKPTPNYRSDADKDDWEYYQKLREGTLGAQIHKFTRGE